MTSIIPSNVSVYSIQQLRIVSYADVAAATLLVWEYIVTLSSEITLVWPSRWGLLKILFILTRYLPFVDVPGILYTRLKPSITVGECSNAFKFTGWLMVFGIVIAEVILVVRTWAIWGRTRFMAICLASVFTLCVVPVIYIESVYLDSVSFTPIPSSGCFVSQGSTLIGIDFIIIITFESFVLVLTLIKGVKHYRHFGVHGCLSVLYRDGILFFVYLLGISVINLAVAVVAPSDLANGLVTLQRVIHATVSARVLINLREAHSTEETSNFIQTSSTFQFRTFAIGRPEVQEDGIRITRQIVENRDGEEGETYEVSEISYVAI